jgi:hypothetical protein
LPSKANAENPTFYQQVVAKSPIPAIHLNAVQSSKSSAFLSNMKKLILMRHGSARNTENRFTGWVDVDLTEKGVTRQEALDAC